MSSSNSNNNTSSSNLNKKKQEEKTVKLLRDLASITHNKQCCDCNQKGPTYVNITLGTFVCTTCCGILYVFYFALYSLLAFKITIYFFIDVV